MHHTRLAALAAASAALLTAPAHAQRIAEIAAGLEKPVDLAEDPTRADRWYVLEQDGFVRIVEDGRLLDTPFTEVDRDNFTGSRSNWERGLLGIAFDTDYATTGQLYLHYSDKDGTMVVSRFTTQDPYTLDWDTEEVLLEIEQPYGNHNGGCIRFGPDGMLYVGPGDGGAANDPHDHGQNKDTLLGTILRIDVNAEPDPGLAYAIPADNPFADADDARPEIWLWGLRNAWKFSWDEDATLWLADVGQNRFEWVHAVPPEHAGANLGWNVIEGLGRFKPGRNPAQDPPRMSPEEILALDIRPPVFEYRHHPTASITGGYVYRGDRLTWLRGRYICADFMSGRVWSFRPVERTSDAGDWIDADDIVEHTDAVALTFGGDGPQLAISSFAQSRDGQRLLLLDHKAGRLLEFEN